MAGYLARLREHLEQRESAAQGSDRSDETPKTEGSVTSVTPAPKPSQEFEGAQGQQFADPVRCPWCRNRQWWVSIHGVRVCRICHPPAVSDLVAGGADDAAGGETE